MSHTSRIQAGNPSPQELVKQFLDTPVSQLEGITADDVAHALIPVNGAELKEMTPELLAQYQDLFRREDSLDHDSFENTLKHILDQRQPVTFTPETITVREYLNLEAHAALEDAFILESTRHAAKAKYPQDYHDFTHDPNGEAVNIGNDNKAASLLPIYLNMIDTLTAIADGTNTSRMPISPKEMANALVATDCARGIHAEMQEYEYQDFANKLWKDDAVGEELVRNQKAYVNSGMSLEDASSKAWEDIVSEARNNTPGTLQNETARVAISTQLHQQLHALGAALGVAPENKGIEPGL
jgi:hypothetical protein